MIQPNGENVLPIERLPNGEWPDEVKRVKDAMDLHAVAGSYGWAVFALADGRPLDNTAYPTWGAAVRAAKWNRDNYMYLEIRPDGMPYGEAAGALGYARTVSKMGWRVPSPDSGHSASVGELASTSGSLSQRYDRATMARQLVSGRPLLPAGYAMSNLPSELPPERRIPAAYRKAQ